MSGEGYWVVMRRIRGRWYVRSFVRALVS
jgi:hypothetical protein